MIAAAKSSVETQARHAWPEMAMPDTGSQSPLYFACKRLLDISIAAAVLLALSPLLLLIALLIKLDAPGPVIFTQDRVGSRRRSIGGRSFWDLRVFRVYKFRSMVTNANESVHQDHIRAFVRGTVQAAEGDGPKFKLVNDSRITRVGRILRKSSLDELPQLFNVLRGEMSLVGPRPVPIYEVAEYDEWHYERLAATPGITGLWQVKGRCEVPFEEMVRLDIEYVRTKSLYLDLQLLARTIPAVISGRGAE